MANGLTAVTQVFFLMFLGLVAVSVSMIVVTLSVVWLVVFSEAVEAVFSDKWVVQLHRVTSTTKVLADILVLLEVFFPGVPGHPLIIS